MRRLICFIGLLLLAFAAPPATAQSSLGGKVVTTCGTPGAFPTSGRPSGFTVDITGKLCTDGGGGGGGSVTQGTSPWVVSGQSESIATTSAAASSIVAKASAGSVVSISGSAVSGSYIMIFDATSAPADGAVTPLKCFGPMSAAGPFALGWGVGPYLAAATGITVVSSSTGCFTKTATNANFISVEYR